MRAEGLHCHYSCLLQGMKTPVLVLTEAGGMQWQRVPPVRHQGETLVDERQELSWWGSREEWFLMLAGPVRSLR